MNDKATFDAVKYRLEKAAPGAGMSYTEAVGLHALECLLRRIADTSGSDELVLRGSLLTRRWVAPAVRPAGDLDFASTAPGADEKRVVTLIKAACGPPPAFPDAAAFSPDLVTGHPIFGYTDFPGVRVSVPVRVLGRRLLLGVDVGFGDPIEPPAELLPYDALLWENGRTVRAASPELGFAWKAHELCASAVGEWRPKDLLDLYLMALHTPLRPELLATALRTAFTSRGTPLSSLDPLRDGSFAWADANRRCWADDLPDFAPASVPRRLEAVVAPVSGVLGSVPDPTAG